MLAEKMIEFIKPLPPGPISWGQFKRHRVGEFFVRTLGLPIDKKLLLVEFSMSEREVNEQLDNLVEEGIIRKKTHFMAGDQELFELALDDVSEIKKKLEESKDAEENAVQGKKAAKKGRG